MVDSEARKRLAGVIRSYLNEEMTAFEFDKALEEFQWNENDKTVGEIAWGLESYQDGLRDHLVVASKAQWDYFQRLLLVLESGCQLETVKLDSRARQFVAAASLALYGLAAFWVGWKPGSLMLLSIPFGLVLILFGWAGRARSSQSANEAAIVPFTSVYQIMQARRRLPGFTKQRYPEALAKRQIRGRILEFLLVGGYAALFVSKLIAMWPVFVAFGLLSQSFSDESVRVADPV